MFRVTLEPGLATLALQTPGLDNAWRRARRAVGGGGGAVPPSALRDVSGIPGLDPLDACGACPEWWLPEMTDIVKCPLVGQSPQS